MLGTSVAARGMSTTVRYKWVFSTHNMKKLAAPGGLGMPVTVFPLNSKCQPGLVRHTPQNVPALEQRRHTTYC